MIGEFNCYIVLKNFFAIYACTHRINTQIFQYVRSQKFLHVIAIYKPLPRCNKVDNMEYSVRTLLTIGVIDLTRQAC